MPDELSLEAVKSKWDKVNDFSEGATNPTTNMEMTTLVMEGLAKWKEEKEAKAAATSAPKVETAAGGKTGLKSEILFAMMNHHLESGNGADIIKKVGATFGWEITKKKGQKPHAVWDCDLKTMPGYVKLQAPNKPDATF